MEKNKTKETCSIKSSELMPKNTFLVGLGSIFNIGGQYFEYNTSESANETDTKALLNEWRNVGESVKEAESELLF
ncbi:hypothetical protein [Sphingobacterium kitahiroshimense]|uniref:hypothetical protein n=1 Tax=Sphingobacterium kitahiroshimense TaxID=470446 RepID=UPI00320B29F2